MKIYIISYKDEHINSHLTEFEARGDYRYNRTDLKPDMHLYVGEVTELTELPKDTAVPMEITKSVMGQPIEMSDASA